MRTERKLEMEDFKEKKNEEERRVEGEIIEEGNVKRKRGG
jgi:hypothetical protein